MRLSTAAACLAVLLATTACAPSDASSATPPVAPPVTSPVTSPGRPGSAWPGVSGDAAHGSPTMAVGPKTARIAWQRALEGPVVPGPVVGRDGSVLAASNGGVLHALDPATGEDRWTFDAHGSYGSDLSTSPAVLDDGTVLWPGPHDRLYGLSADGRLLWTEQLDAFVLSPAVVGRVAYVADAGGTVLALDLPRGGPPRQRWSLELGGTSYSSPAVAPDGTVYVAAGTRLSALIDEGARASVRWTYDTHELVEVSPAVAADGTVVIGSNGLDELGLRPDGTVRWRYRRGDWTYSSAVVRQGRAYFGDHLGFVDVVDVSTGVEVRRHLGIPKAQGTTSAGTGIWTAPLVDADGDVFAGSAAGHVYGFDAAGGNRWDADVGGIVASYPALTADGTLVIGSTNGTLYAFADR